MSVEHGQEGAPRADGIGVLLRHGLDDLVQVVEVVHYPRREQLRQSHLAEGWMTATALELRGADELPELDEVLPPGLGETIEDLRERPALELRETSLPVHRLELVLGAVLEDDPGAVEPVTLLDVQQVPAYLVRRPRVGSLSPVQPLIGVVEQECVQHIRGAAQHLGGCLNSEVHTQCLPRAASLRLMLGERWGVTDAEVARHYPCDDIVASPALAVWRGVTVDSSPEQVWLWLRQLQLAPYSYDWVDNLGRRSPRELRPVGDPQPGERMSCVGGRIDIGWVLSTVPGEHLTGTILGAVMSYVLVPEGTSTRLLLKIVLKRGGLRGRLLALGDWPMARRQLLNYKCLAEQAPGSPS